MLIKCFLESLAVEESLIFIFQSSMKGLEDSTVGDTGLHAVSSQSSRTESHVVLGHGIALGRVFEYL